MAVKECNGEHTWIEVFPFVYNQSFNNSRKYRACKDCSAAQIFTHETVDGLPSEWMDLRAYIVYMKLSAINVQIAEERIRTIYKELESDPACPNRPPAAPK